MKFKSVKPFLSDEGLFGIKPYNVDWAITDNWKKAKNKVLVVVEFVPSIDLKEKSLMGHTLSQQTYSNLFDYTFSEVKKLNSKVKQSDWGFMFVNFNHFKWFDLSPQQKDVCIGAATKRMRRIIKKIPHTHLLLMGDTVAAKILDDPDANTKRLWVHDNKGTPTVNTIGIDRSFSASKSDDDDLDDDAIDQANILGYASRCIQNLILGYNPYHIDVKPKAKLIKTIKEFDALYKELKKAKRVAVDTEGTSLETIENKLATIQFATSSDIGYVIPWYHQDSTWSVSEFKYLRKKLRKLFTSNGTEYKGTKTKFLIGQNFGYDIRVLSKELNIRYWSHNTWDLMAGEFLLDENIKVLRTYGTSAYGLAQICMNYGCDFYYTASFSKSQRTLIAHQELTQEVLDYTTMDVQVMIAIQEQQMKRANNILHVDDKPYTKDYHRLMLTQLSSMIRVMSIMKYRGNTIDIEYLLSLLRPDSPISSKIDELTKEFYELPEVKKASKLLNEDKGAPSGGLFGQSFSSFNLSKKAHLQTLFIDVLGLEPLRYGKSGDPSFDKMFLKTYEEENRSVAIINDLNKLGKLKSSYIDAFYGHVEESHDGRIDKRLRPDFGYTGVVTGRSNSSKPSFQQIPEHSADAKIIKRMFISPPMVLPFEADYSAHEVRCLNLNNYVITSKGLKRLFEIIAINDDSYLVLSHNHKTGKDEYKRIGYKSAHTTEFDHLEIVHEHGMLACTANHQIWSITRNAYVYADQLQVGEELLTNDYLSRPTKIVCIENYGKQSHLVGDIGIFDNHNLYVQATDLPDEKPVLVHNCWGIAADDDSVKSSFLNIHNLIIKYRHDPTEKNLKRKETEGDPHKQNYHKFTKVPLDKIDKVMRQQAKSIVFGCFTKDTIVSTEKGPVRIGNLADTKRKPKVITQGGVLRKSGGAVSQGVKPIVSVLTRQGELKGTNGHKILTVSPKLKLEYKALADLKHGDQIVYQQGTFGNVRPIMGGKHISTKDAYCLGMFTADGSANFYNSDSVSYNYRVNHSSGDLEEVKKMQMFFKKWGGVKAPIANQLEFDERFSGCGASSINLNNKRLYNILKDFGVTGLQKDRRVPDQILSAERKFVAAYLSGYFDGDGYMRFSSNEHLQIGATTNNPGLATDIIYMLSLFGIKASMYGGQYTTGNGFETQSYEIIITGVESQLLFLKHIGFKTLRKKERAEQLKETLPDLRINVLKYGSYKDTYQELRKVYAKRAGVNTFRSRDVYYKGVLIPPMKRYMPEFMENIHQYKSAFEVLGLTSVYETLEVLASDTTQVTYVFREALDIGEQEVFDVVNVVKDHSWSANGHIVSNSMYGKGDNALARDINLSVDEARKIKNKFFKEFHKGKAWLTKMVTYAQEHLFAVSPIGRRRNLFGNLSGHNAMRAAVQRRAQNSPIQGFASDICFMAADIYARTIHELFNELGIKHKSSKVGTAKTDITYLPTGPNVMVHDSIKAEMPIEYYLLGMHILEWSMTHGVTQYLRETHGVITGVPFDIEFSVGADWSHKDDWDFSANHMEKAIKQTLLDHKALYPDNAKVQAIDPDKTYAYMVDCYHEQCKQLKLRERFPLNID